MTKFQLQDFVEYGRLFDLYGGLLSADRQKIMSDYFEFNMTLAEIAQEKNISRQAVLDAIDKSCEKLKEFESVLQIYAKRNALRADLTELLNLAESKELKEKVEEILRKL